MALQKVPQTNFTSGVLEAEIAAREDIVFYYNGLQDAVNALIMPGGGMVARPGKQFLRRIARSLEPVDLSAATFTAPQGGTAGNAKDGDLAVKLTTDNNLAATNSFIVLKVAFGASVTFDAVDILDFQLESGSLVDEFRVQTSADDATWSDYATPFDWDAQPRSRRLRSGLPVTAAYLRIVRIGATNIAAKAVVAEIRVWRQAEEISNSRLIPFTYETEEALMMVTTDKNIDVVSGTAFHGSISIPHSSTQLPFLNWAQAYDTLLLFHKAVPPEKIFRQGGNDEFDFRPAVFTEIPQFDFGAGVGGQNEIQYLSVSALGEGSGFTLLLEGERTTRITRNVGESIPTVSTKIETLLRALPNTSDDGITVVYDAGGFFVVTFGGEDGKQPWGEISVTVLAGDSVWSTSRFQKGKYPGEDIMSAARGWPRCGLFAGERLHVGGIPGVPDAHIMSTTTDYYSFDTEIDNDTKALMFRPQGDKIAAIYNIVEGRHLSMFTNDGEYFYPGEALTDESVPKRTSGCGSKEGMRVHEVEGALLFTQGFKKQGQPRETGTSVREFIFEETTQRYNSSLLSKLSSDLIKNPVDDAMRPGVSTKDFNLLLQVNEDGSGTAYTALRDDAVNAFIPLATRAGDKLRTVGVDKMRRIYFDVERIINGEKVRYLEMWNPDLLLDCGDIVTIDAEESIATGGQIVFVWGFSPPETEEAIGVRINGGRLSSDDYTVDLEEQTIALTGAYSAGLQDGDVVRISPMINRLTGLDHVEGEMVDTVIDGTQGGKFLVQNGVLDLGDYADTEVQYGFDFEVRAALMPLRIPNSETLVGEKVRVVNAIFQLHKTGGIEIRANDRSWQELPLLQMGDDILDRSTKELEFTGISQISGLKGHAVGAPLEFRRPGPVPFCVLGVTREVSL